MTATTLPDINSLASYGGALNDYRPVTDPTTDRPAAAANQAYADCAAMTATADRAWCEFTAAATTGAMVLVAHNALWGNAAGVAPTLARTTTGTFTITWPATVTDALSNIHTLNIRASGGNSRSATVGYTINCVPTSGNVVTVYIFSGGSLNDAAGVNFDVWWM